MWRRCSILVCLRVRWRELRFWWRFCSLGLGIIRLKRGSQQLRMKRERKGRRRAPRTKNWTVENSRRSKRVKTPSSLHQSEDQIVLMRHFLQMQLHAQHRTIHSVTTRYAAFPQSSVKADPSGEDYFSTLSLSDPDEYPSSRTPLSAFSNSLIGRPATSPFVCITTVGSVPSPRLPTGMNAS
jgi:hypothetical protein